MVPASFRRIKIKYEKAIHRIGVSGIARRLQRPEFEHGRHRQQQRHRVGLYLESRQSHQQHFREHHRHEQQSAFEQWFAEQELQLTSIENSSTGSANSVWLPVLFNIFELESLPAQPFSQ